MEQEKLGQLTAEKGRIALKNLNGSPDLCASLSELSHVALYQAKLIIRAHQPKRRGSEPDGFLEHLSGIGQSPSHTVNRTQGVQSVQSLALVRRGSQSLLAASGRFIKPPQQAVHVSSRQKGVVAIHSVQ